MIVTEGIKEINARQIVGTLRPSGRFTVCQVFRRRAGDVKAKEVQAEKNSEVCDVQYLDFVYRSILDGTWYGLRSLSTLDQSQRKTLGLSIGTNSPNRARRGARGITSRQRDILCWGANSLERCYGKDCMSFLTLTLPDLSQRDFDAVRENWSDIVHRVVLRIKEKLLSYGCRTEVAGCTELQLERSELSGRYYPHLHLVFRGKFHRRADWLIKPSGFRCIWERCVSKFLRDKVSGWNASENVTRVKSSSGGYLAKYISKCASKQGVDLECSWHPSDWIVLSRRVRALYERLTHKGYELGYTLLGIVAGWRVGMGFKQPIVISTAVYGDRTIGQWGWLKGEEKFPTYAQIHQA